MQEQDVEEGCARCPRFLERFRNRNRVGPRKVELPECDFFVVGPRRTLRVLLPTTKSGAFYENPNPEQTESANDNFFSRWSRRPHPSGNCRCSYRQSKRLNGIAEEKISHEIERIRTSLCEAEKSGQGIEEIEKRVSKNLEILRIDVESPEKIAKDRIVKDLERYINDLLEEILSDTVKVLSDTDKRVPEKDPTLDISFAFYDAKTEQLSSQNLNQECGYSNPAFIGSKDNPDALTFHHLEPCSTTMLENADCADSGIKSVETVELQQPEEQQTLEESLMEIIDSKLGKSLLEKSLEDLTIEMAEYGDQIKKEQVERVEQQVQEVKGLEIPEKASGFDKLRLEFKDKEVTCTRNVAMKMNRTVTVLRKKIATLGGTKKSQEKMSKEVEEKKPKKVQKDEVIFRRNRKPMIVFLHGFGSSADVFEHQLRYFSDLGYPCVAPEMLGHGMSSSPRRSRDYQFSKLLRDLDAVLNHYAFQPEQKCIIVGHNYGCSFATALASKYDENISQLVLINGGGPTPLAPPSREGLGHCLLRGTLAPFLMCGLHRDILYSARGRQHPYCGPEPEEQWPSHMKYVLSGMLWPEGDYLLHRRITTPTLLVHGLRDNSVSLVQECQMERTMAKAFLEAMPMAGHLPMTDCPEQLNHMIHCFIDLYLWKNKKC